ncbi:MAG: hypothetical protein K2L05_00450, partial [Muribaculaceae bacterium]|nr:hypothetical protein [Muribaculaceae bacterium]
ITNRGLGTAADKIQRAFITTAIQILNEDFVIPAIGMAGQDIDLNALRGKHSGANEPKASAAAYTDCQFVHI